MSVQLRVPHSEHAKAPMGPLTMGLPLAVDPKKLGEFPQSFGSLRAGLRGAQSLVGGAA